MSAGVLFFLAGLGVMCATRTKPGFAIACFLMFGGFLILDISNR